eukprot:1156204-Pelagomonas_calceolata.AAC.11
MGQQRHGIAVAWVSRGMGKQGMGAQFSRGKRSQLHGLAEAWGLLDARKSKPGGKNARQPVVSLWQASPRPHALYNSSSWSLFSTNRGSLKLFYACTWSRKKVLIPAFQNTGKVVPHCEEHTWFGEGVVGGTCWLAAASMAWLGDSCLDVLAAAAIAAAAWPSVSTPTCTH